MRTVIAERGQAEAERQHAEESLADERDAHEETRAALAEWETSAYRPPKQGVCKISTI